MGMIIMTGDRFYTYLGSDDKEYKHKGRYFTEKDATEKLLRYIFRQRENETRGQDVKAWGVWGAVSYTGTVEDIIFQFKRIQETYGKIEANKRRMYHFIFSFSDNEINDFNDDVALYDQIARLQASIFWRMGFPTAYAVHFESGKRWHIHFAVNAVSYVTWKKFRYSLADWINLQSAMNHAMILACAEYYGETLTEPIYYMNPETYNNRFELALRSR